MLVLEQRQHVQETRDPHGAHEQRERNICFLDVSFKWGENYKKHTSRTEFRSQGQTPVRRAHMQHCSFSETYSRYSYTTSKTSVTVLQYFTMVIFYSTCNFTVCNMFLKNTSPLLNFPMKSGSATEKSVQHSSCALFTQIKFRAKHKTLRNSSDFVSLFLCAKLYIYSTKRKEESNKMSSYSFTSKRLCVPI